MKFIDAHHHLWDLDACSYPWLEARGVERFFGDPTAIQKNYLLEDFLQESVHYRPTRSVHIQVGVAPGAEVKESAWIVERSHKPEALVCFVDLASGDRESVLDAQCAITRVTGVRQILGRHRDEDSKYGSDTLIDNPEFARGLESLAKRRLSFDLQLIPEQHQRVAHLLEEVDELQVAVCHAGSPWDQSPSGLQRWKQGLRQLSARVGTTAKLSGLGMFKRNWTVEDLAPIVHSVIDCFGPSRVMVGSNFPVDKLYQSYDQWWQAIEELFERYTPEERQQMLVGTAARFYHLDRYDDP